MGLIIQPLTTYLPNPLLYTASSKPANHLDKTNPPHARSAYTHTHVSHHITSIMSWQGNHLPPSHLPTSRAKKEE